MYNKRYSEIVIEENDWNTLCWSLGLTSDARLIDVVDAVRKQKEDRKLLVDSLRLCFQGDPDLVDQKLWKLPDWDEYDFGG